MKTIDEIAEQAYQKIVDEIKQALRTRQPPARGWGVSIIRAAIEAAEPVHRAAALNRAARKLQGSCFHSAGEWASRELRRLADQAEKEAKSAAAEAARKG